MDLTYMNNDDFFPNSFSIAIEDAYPGMRLKDDIYSNNRILLSRGVQLTDSSIYSLKKAGIRNISVFLPKLAPVSCIESLCEKTKKELELMDHLDHPKLVEIKNFVAKLIANINRNDFFIPLTMYKSLDRNTLAAHSSRVCVYSLILANAFNKEMALQNRGKEAYLSCEDVGLAAILHDVGIACHDENIRSKVKFVSGFKDDYPKLKKENLALVIQNYNHDYDPYYAFCMLLNQKEISQRVRNMIFFSRENALGTGSFNYPGMKRATSYYQMNRNLVGAEIIHLASDFDNMICANISKRTTLERVTLYLQDFLETQTYHPELINSLVKNIPLYPRGTKVQLQGNYQTLGIVTHSHTNIEQYGTPEVAFLSLNNIYNLSDNTYYNIRDVLPDDVFLDKYELAMNNSKKL